MKYTAWTETRKEIPHYEALQKAEIQTEKIYYFKKEQSKEEGR
jgi:hypothetical protein